MVVVVKCTETGKLFLLRNVERWDRLRDEPQNTKYKEMWRGKMPSQKKIERECMGEIATCPKGCRLEPDADSCKHGLAAWPVLLSLI